jgi:hypothetical protein
MKKSSAIPFLDRKKIGFWKSFFKTWWLASCYPSQFFLAVGESQDLFSAFCFFLTSGMAGVFLNFLLQIPFMGEEAMIANMMQQGLKQLAPAMGALGKWLPLLPSIFVKMQWIALLFSPVTILAGFLFSAVVLHVVLLLIKAAPKGLKVTFQALAYASAPNAVPYIGWLWTAVIAVVALSQSHGVSPWKIGAAYILQLFFYLFLFAIPLLFLIKFFVGFKIP